MEDMPLMEDNTITMECVETFKNVLSSTIDKLYKTIGFLQNEIEEKNLFIKTLIFSNANGGGKVDMELILSSDIRAEEVETTLNSTNSEDSSKSNYSNNSYSNYSLDVDSKITNETVINPPIAIEQNDQLLLMVPICMTRSNQVLST